MYNGLNVNFTNDRFGNSNSALSFQDGFYTVPADVYFSGDFTISVWIKINTLVEWGTILDFGCYSAYGNKYDVYLTPSEKDPNIGQPSIYMYDSNGRFNRFLSNNILNEKFWNFFVLTLSGNTAKLYINGTLTDTFYNFPVPANVVRDSNYVGGDNFNSALLKSDLDYLRIYKRALNETEIDILYNFQPTISSTMAASTISVSTTSKSEAITTSSLIYTTSDASILSSAKETTFTANSTSTTETLVSSSLPSSISFTQVNPFSSTKNISASIQLDNLTSLNQLSSAEVVNILSQDFDLNNCLLNCSNNGFCRFDKKTNKFGCECFEYFSGARCETDLRPCSKSPCLNNGVCVQNETGLELFSFYCQCSQFYEGDWCEVKKDLCANETCSNHGSCVDLQNQTKCNCVFLYGGHDCEFKSESMKTIESVVKSSAIIAILFMVLLGLLILLSDLFNCFLK